MDRNKLIRDLASHVDREDDLTVAINKEKNPNKAYKLMGKLYVIRAEIAKLINKLRKMPHNKGENEFDITNPNYDKIDYSKIDKK